MADKKNGCIYYDYHKKTDKEEVIFTAWRSFFNWMSVIIAVLFVFFVASIIFFRPVSVFGVSMENTLSHGDRLLVYSLDYTPHNGDIIVATKENTDEPVIKRIIARENQVVSIDYENGTVAVDGVILDEGYVKSMEAVPENEISYPYVVPEGHCFVMGDFRDDSIDSRYKDFGCIDSDDIVGKVVFRFYPFSSFGIVA